MKTASRREYGGANILIMILILTSSVPQWAQRAQDYHTATIVNVDVSIDAGPSHYTVRIQDGSSEYAGDYLLHLLHPRIPDDLKVGSQVQYRISGRHLFVKRPNGKELKTKLCVVRERMIIC